MKVSYFGYVLQMTHFYHGHEMRNFKTNIFSFSNSFMGNITKKSSLKPMSL